MSTKRSTTVSNATDQAKKRKVITTITTSTTITTEEQEDGIGSIVHLVNKVDEMSPIQQQALLRQLDLVRNQIKAKQAPVMNGVSSTVQLQNSEATNAHVTTSADTQFDNTAAEVLSYFESQPDTSFPVLSSVASGQQAPSVDPYAASNIQASTQVPGDTEIIEKGHVYFFYRPRVGVQQVTSLNDVQRLYILLKTISNDQGCSAHYRLIRIGKKKLPSIKEHNRFWGIVEESTQDIGKIHQLLSFEQYTTITRGERTVLPCRPAGEGFYGIVRHQSTTHLAYILELPHDIGQVQQTFNIEKRASFFLTVKNPLVPNPSSTPDQTIDQPGLPNPNVSQVIPQAPMVVPLPETLQAAFGQRRWAPALPLDMLNYKGMELVLIGESNNLTAEFGYVGTQLENEEKAEESKMNSDLVYKELGLSKDRHPVEPLIRGQWV